MDAEKLKKRLEKATPDEFAKFVTQAVDRLVKAADFLGKASKAIGKAIETHDKMGEHMDGMAGHMSNMKDCMGKAIATGKLGKVEDAGEAKDMTTHMSGMETHHGALDKLIASQEEHLDNAEGAIDDAVDSADEETDKGLAAAERTEKNFKREIARIQKASARENANNLREMKKQMDATVSSLEKGFNALLTALAPPAVPDHVQKAAVPFRAAVTLEKAHDTGNPGATAATTPPGAPPVAKISTGAQIEATDEYGMPNPEYLKAVEAGQLGRDGGGAFVKAAKDVPLQEGNPFPKNETNLFAEAHPRGPIN
jgi:exonuclease VII small subunit